RIKELNPQSADEIEEGVEFITRFMNARGIVDPRTVPVAPSEASQSYPASPYPQTPAVVCQEDNFDPYAHNTDVKGSFFITQELDGAAGRKSKLSEALVRFRNMRRSGRHPRYIVYAKLISAASKEDKFDLCQEILAMARNDVPPLPQYPAVRYGWSSILDAMIGACLSHGHRAMAEEYHQELLAMGCTPSANTY